MVLLLFVDLDPDLAALTPLGGYFVLRAGGAAHGALPTLAQAYENRPSEVYGNLITFHVKKVASVLRTAESRIAASLFQQGLAARLWSVTLGCALAYGGIPDLDPRLLRWDPDASTPDDLWLSEVRPLPADAPAIADVVLHAHLEPLAAALRAHHRVAPGLLWGNAASALVGTARQLGPAARPLTAELLAHPLLSGTGTLTGSSFRRRSCCLYYRVPGGGTCGDCCFTRPPRSSAHGTSG
ncbi:(2Fe-2S)-binding protein [Streptomyces sp. NPDC005648]|uniref:(2Fe-2S)-binding protein n=1 Tax=Streptomyces sp. NPDC005648 TaxID=3157044 RepID=UPI0033A737F0